MLLDIGAHIGLMTRQLMHMFPNITAAVCYEPHPLNFATLSRNVGHLKNCSLVHAAVGTVAGQFRFYEDIHNTGNYSLNIDAMLGREYHVTQVECVKAHDEEFLHRLSPETAQLPIIWKSDTQGLDEIIVTSLSDDFWNRVPIVLMEISRMNRPALDTARLSRFLERFSVRRFGGSPRLLSVEQILRFADGTDGSHQDLQLAKS